MDTNHSCLNINIRPSDYHYGDGRLRLGGVTTQNWISHFDFFVPQRITGGDTDDCWDFGATKNLDAFMDAMISDNVLPASVVQKITAMGFMDKGIDGKFHFHSSERFAGVLSGLGQKGGSLYTAYDIFRKYGVVPFTLLPVSASMTIEQYFSPIPQNIMDIGAEFLALMGGKDFCQYQWINDGGATNVQEMADVIGAGPLNLGIPVDVAGWNQEHPTVTTGSPVHVVSCYEVPVPFVNISDNYSPYLKVLDPGYQISYVLQPVIQYFPSVSNNSISNPSVSNNSVSNNSVALPTNIAPTKQNVQILQTLVSLWEKLILLLTGQ